MRKLIALGVVGALLGLNTLTVDRDQKDARADGGRILELAGADVHVRDEGDRSDPPVVLLHGFACSLGWWDGVAARLKRNHRVVRVDLLGHGGSEKPRGDYSLERQAELVAGVIEQLRLRRATVVGHSMGGSVAAALAEQRPELVARLAVIGTPPRDGFAELPLTGRMAKWPVLGELIRRLAPDSVIRAGLESAFAPGFEVPDRYVDDVNRMTYSSFKGASDGSQEFVEQRPLPERIGRKRLLVIFGSVDDIVDPKAADAWEEDMPSARVVRLRGVGHSPHVERAGTTAELIGKYAK